MEPALAEGVTSALYAPTAGTVNPWELGIAACENAAANGAELFLNTRVLSIGRTAEGYRVETDHGDFSCRAVVNCAGINADRVQELLFPSPVHIAPDAADYLILDKTAANKPTRIIQYEPEDGGKGLSAVPTVEGSLLLGPSERENETDFAVSAAGLSFVRERAGRVLPGLDLNDTIRSFAAVRPNPQRSDGSSIGSFVIEHPGPAFWSLIGIKTPGLTCADELGRYLADKIAAELDAEENPDFDPHRAGIRRVRNLTLSERTALVRENPDYGEILCHCEDVTKAEILEAIRRGAVSVVEAEFSVFDLHPGRAFAFSPEDQRVEAGLLQIVAEVAAAVGGGGDPRQRGEGGDIEAVGRWRPRAGQRPRGDHDQVFGIEGRLPPGQIVVEDFGGHGLAADILFPVQIGPEIVFGLPGTQIQQRHPAHITAIVCHKILPAVFASIFLYLTTKAWD